MALDDEVPVVDLQGVDGERRALVLQQIRRACEDWGMFQVVNHGVPGALLTTTLQQAKEFFSLPVEEKGKLSVTDSDGAVLVPGYSSSKYGKCFLQWGEQLRHVTSPVWERNDELWPTNPPSYRETLEEYVAAQEKFVSHALGLVSESLHLKNSAIADVFSDIYMRTIVANHYPPSPDQAIGLAGHTDFSILTIILQDCAGLEAQGRDGGWRAVEPVPGALVVNLADQIQVLSNGRYRGGVHRATVDGERKRVSVNMFTYPLDDAVVAPIPGLGRPLYQGHSYSDYRAAFVGRLKEKKAFLESGNPALFDRVSS